MACNLSFNVKNGVLKVTGSHVQFNSGSISEMMLRCRNKSPHTAVTYGLFNSSNCDDLGCMSRSFNDCNIFQLG